MRWVPGLGSVNFALVSLYFVPVWGRDALRALISPYRGFEDRGHATIAGFFREIFDLGLDGLLRVSSALAGIKLVIAAGFLAYLIEFARALVVGRELNRETRDGVLGLAVIAVLVWTLPGLTLNDPGLIRLSATQLMLVAGAVVVITVERHIEEASRRSLPAAALVPEAQPQFL